MFPQRINVFQNVSSAQATPDLDLGISLFGKLTLCYVLWWILCRNDWIFKIFYASLVTENSTLSSLNWYFPGGIKLINFLNDYFIVFVKNNKQSSWPIFKDYLDWFIFLLHKILWLLQFKMSSFMKIFRLEMLRFYKMIIPGLDQLYMVIRNLIFKKLGSILLVLKNKWMGHYWHFLEIANIYWVLPLCNSVLSMQHYIHSYDPHSNFFT